MPKKTTLRKRVKTLLIVALILSPFLLLGWGHVWGFLRVQSHVRAIRKAGDPATLEDLDDLAQQVALQAYAAAFYDEVFASLVLDDMETRFRVELPTVWRIQSGKQAWPLPEEDRQWVEEVLEADEEALALLKEAPQIHGRVFDGLCLDWPDGFVVTMESLHRVVDLLLLNVLYAVDQADTVTVTESSKAALCVADTLRETPFGFAQGHRRGLVSRVTATLGWASGKIQLSRDQQRDLDQRFDAVAWPMSRRDSLVSERCAFRAVYGHPTPEILREFGFSRRIGTAKREPIHAGWISAFKWSGLLRHSEANFLRQSEKVIDASLQWKPGQATDMRRLTGLGDRPWPITLTSLFMSYAESACAFPLSVQARLEVLRATLAARQYHQQTGQWAQALSDLVPGYMATMPLDPFTGMPIHYQTRQGGRAVFSVGLDLQVSQAPYFEDENDRRTCDDIIMWLEPPEAHPDMRHE